MSAPPTFAADAMLGALARWLRLLGYNCTYSRDVGDDELIAEGAAEGRVVLTRDRDVARRASRSVFVPPGTLDDELLTVARALRLDLPAEPPAVFCSVCNGLLEPAPRASAKDGVPPRVVELRLDLWRCPGCQRHYWRGSHLDTMAVRLSRLRAALQEAP